MRARPKRRGCAGLLEQAGDFVDAGLDADLVLLAAWRAGGADQEAGNPASGHAETSKPSGTATCTNPRVSRSVRVM